MSTTVIRKACARFPGFVLLAVTPFRGIRGIRRCVPKNAFFSKIRPRTGKSVSALTKTYLADTFWDPEIFPVFSIFQPPQHRPHVELRRPGSALRNPGVSFFLLEDGLRDLGAGVRSLGSGVAGFGFPRPGSIYTYSRSTAPAAVMLNEH